ncbi:MAG: 30S ribosomal protein S13 [Chloroflexi bacterium]|nr:30S ribosomal protein S13 [Chloroflexota bacterium]
MARIAGVDLPREKHVDVALRYIYGIGPHLGRRVIEQARVDPTIKVKDLKEDEVSRIREIIEKSLKVEGELRKEVSLNVKRLTEIGSYRGMRHRRNLPVRGQRTKTNARTKRGARRTVAGRGQKRGTGKK